MLVGLVRGGCKRWPCGFVDRPGRICGWVLVDCPEGCWSPTLGLSPYRVPREVICQWMTAEEVLILAINNLRAIWRRLTFWTCGPLTGFWCRHSTGKKATFCFTLFCKTAPHFVIATGAEPGTSNFPGVSGVYPILFSAVFFFFLRGIRCKQWHISYSSSISGYFGAGVPHMLVLFCAITVPTWQFVWQGIPLARMEQEVKAPWFWFVKGSDLGMWLAGSYDSYNDALQGLACDAQSLGHQGAQWAFSCAQLLSWRAPLMRKQLAELQRFHIWFHGRLEAFCFGMCWFSIPNCPSRAARGFCLPSNK